MPGWVLFVDGLRDYTLLIAVVVFGYGGQDRGEQNVFIERLGQVGRHAAAEGLLSHPHLVPAGDDDARNANAFTEEVLLNLQAGKPGQVQIHNRAIGLASCQRRQKLFPRAKRVHFMPRGPEQTLQCFSYTFFIVYHRNCQPWFSHVRIMGGGRNIAYWTLGQYGDGYSTLGFLNARWIK